MKCFVIGLGLFALAANALEHASYQYANPAGVTFRGFGFSPNFAIGPAIPAAHPAYAAYPAPAPVAPVAAAGPVAYAHHHVAVPGVADVPVTKLAYTQGLTQKLVDFQQPAVTNRRIKVRRPALRKEFYDIEHRIIVKPAGSATLELSTPVGKEQVGPAVVTPTSYQQIAPVVRYGTSRQLIDGQQVSEVAQTRANLAQAPAGPARLEHQPQPEFQAYPQSEQPQFRTSQAPQPEYQQPNPQQQHEQPQFRAAPAPQPEYPQPNPQPQHEQPQLRAAPAPQPAGPRPLQLRPQQPQPAQLLRSAQPQPQPQPPRAPRPLQLRPEGPFPGQPQLRSADAEVIDADSALAQGPRPQPQPHPGHAAGPAPLQARLGLDMPAELQSRLLELLSARGGTVTEVLNENGQPLNVLQVADAVQDIQLQGGERVTTRRIVVTRPIETIQEIDIQEPATKIHRAAVNVPTLFKTPVQTYARVPTTAFKNVATPIYAGQAYAAY